MNKFPFVAFMALTLEVFSAAGQPADCAKMCPKGSFCKSLKTLDTVHSSLPNAVNCPELESAKLIVFTGGSNVAGDHCPHAILKHCLALPGYYRNIGSWNYGEATPPIETKVFQDVDMDNGNRDYQTPILWWNPQNVAWKSLLDVSGSDTNNEAKGHGYTSKNAAKRVFGTAYAQNNVWTATTLDLMPESTYGSEELFVECKSQASTFGAVDTRMVGQTCDFADGECPAGTYLQTVGSAKGCWPCPIAKPYSIVGASAVSSCMLCEPGYTTKAGAAVGAESLCPIHPSYPTPNIPLGNKAGGLADSFICQQGFYCTGNEKFLCPGKFKTSPAGSTEVGNCVDMEPVNKDKPDGAKKYPTPTHPSALMQFRCSPGFYPKVHSTKKEDDPGRYPNWDCELCPQSSYCPADPKTLATKKIDCDEKADVIKSLTETDTQDKSKMANLTGQWSESYCRCPGGTYLENNKCTICPVGYMCHGNAKIVCKWCTKTGSKQGAATTATQASAVSLLVVFCYIFILTPLRLVTA